MKTERNIANWQVAVYALYLLGGAKQRIHTEDVALKAFELAPRQFCWRKHPDLPDCDISRIALSDAAKVKNGAHVSMEGPSQREGMWFLTSQGVNWIKANEDTLSRIIKLPQERFPREYATRQLYSLTKHAAFVKFQSEKNCDGIEDYEFVESLRCTINSPTDTIKARLEEVRSLATQSEREDILEYLSACEAKFLRSLS